MYIPIYILYNYNLNKSIFYIFTEYTATGNNSRKVLGENYNKYITFKALIIKTIVF